MPSISSRTVAPAEIGYESVGVPPRLPEARPSITSASGPADPGLNPTLRCTLPPIFAATDNLRQFYRGSAIPQARFLPAPLINK